MTPEDEAYAWAFSGVCAHTDVHREWLVTKGLLLLARETGRVEEFRKAWLEARADRMAWMCVKQRQWQSRVSKRPWRGRHWDSWAIREQYVAPHSVTEKERIRGRNHQISKAARDAGSWVFTVKTDGESK